MEDKKCSMCACNGANSGCGHQGNNWMTLGGHHHLTRAFLYLIVLLFVFWIGLGLGELKGYLRYAPFDSGYGMYPMWMMRQNNTNRPPANLMQTPAPYDNNVPGSQVPGMMR